jgi:hypothetical protein
MPVITSTFPVTGIYNLETPKQNANSLNNFELSFYVEDIPNIKDNSYFQVDGKSVNHTVMSKAMFSSGTANEFIKFTNQFTIYGQYPRATKYVSLITDLDIVVLDQQNYVVVTGGTGTPVILSTIPFWS